MVFAYHLADVEYALRGIRMYLFEGFCRHIAALTAVKFFEDSKPIPKKNVGYIRKFFF